MKATIFDLEKKDGTYVYSDEFKSAAKNMNKLISGGNRIILNTESVADIKANKKDILII